MRLYLITMLAGVLWGCLNLAYGQSVSSQVSARGLGLANATAALHDEWSLFNNIGGIGRIKKTAALFALEQTPALQGANRVAAGFATVTRLGTAGFSVFKFGDAIYHEQVASASFGNHFGNTSLGVRVNHLQYRSEIFGTQSGLSFDFGGVTQIIPKVIIGAYGTNITQSVLRGKSGERIPSQFFIGAGYQADKNLWLTTELEKDLDRDPIWKIGIEYQVYKKISFRTGYNVNPAALFMGCGFQKKKLRADYAIKLTPLTGASHQVSASITWDKPTKK